MAKLKLFLQTRDEMWSSFLCSYDRRPVRQKFAWLYLLEAQVNDVSTIALSLGALAARLNGPSKF